MTFPLFDAIHHVAIIASDYPRSRHFYHEVLGLPIIAETLREARQSWKLDLALPDGSQLELFSFPSPPERPSRPLTIPSYERGVARLLRYDRHP